MVPFATLILLATHVSTELRARRVLTCLLLGDYSHSRLKWDTRPGFFFLLSSPTSLAQCEVLQVTEK